jgi:hypothetical protein
VKKVIELKHAVLVYENVLLADGMLFGFQVTFNPLKTEGILRKFQKK